MKGFMCYTQAKNNEEFKAILKRRGWTAPDGHF